MMALFSLTEIVYVALAQHQSFAVDKQLFDARRHSTPASGSVSNHPIAPHLRNLFFSVSEFSKHIVSILTDTDQ